MNNETFQNQLKQTYRAFRGNPKTMLQVSEETGIMRASICRYVAYLKKRNKIAEVKKGKCPLSGHKAGFLSTEPELIPKPGQAEMFKPKSPVV